MMATTKKKPAAPKKPAGKPPGATSKRAKGPKTPKDKAPKVNKGPGVIASLVEFLSAASKDKPLSKDAMLDKLAKRFPDRDADAMKKTIGCQLGARIQTEQGIKLHKNDDGYWAT